MKRWVLVAVAFGLVMGGFVPTPFVASAANTSTVSIGDAAVVEGHAGVRVMHFAVTLSAPSSTVIDVNYTVGAVGGTLGSTCVPGVDFRGTPSVKLMRFGVGASGLTAVVKDIAVTICPDALTEGAESVVITLTGATGGATIGKAVGTGRIRDDDPSTGVRVSVGDASIVEGDVTKRAVKTTISLSVPAPITVGVDYRIVPVTATGSYKGSGTIPPGADLVDALGATKRLTFVPGVVHKAVSTVVLADSRSEGPETFSIVLSNPSTNLFFGRASGTATIIDDDAARRPLIGAAVSYNALAQDAPYATIAGARFDVLAPENEMKWETVQPQQGVFRFAVPDAMVDFAEQHGEAVFGQALAWHFQNPSWLTNGSFDRDQLVQILTNHAATVVARYRGRVAGWVVVNEAIGDNAQLRPSVWLDGIGADYIDRAFLAARAADPSARLYINDYGVEMPGPKANALYSLVSGLVARGVPIDGVGFQGHVAVGDLSASGLAGEMQRYRNLGLDVSITELDVRLQLPADSGELAAQASTYQLALDVCRAAPNCVSFFTWGFTDRYSWIPSFFPGFGAALPWDTSLQPKPAYVVLAPYLRG